MSYAFKEVFEVILEDEVILDADRSTHQACQKIDISNINIAVADRHMEIWECTLHPEKKKIDGAKEGEIETLQGAVGIGWRASIIKHHYFMGKFAAWCLLFTPFSLPLYVCLCTSWGGGR